MSDSISPYTLELKNSKAIISVQNVGKMYKLYDQPVERLKDTLFWRFGKIYGREFWAVKDISFEVQKGEAMGIVGRNGSGKSTLLQIIAGVLAPTIGEVSVKGRVSALLELGSGFNPDYTGRENIYMSGALLGLNKEEMDNKFDFIADFADIGEFIDQPVKLFSSGMFARLAFSVAVAVDPDILIVDEILSVGDYNFQQKCIARMKHMRDNGLTLLFVSHSTDAIKDTCEKGLFLNQGKPIYWGTAAEASDNYLKYMRELANLEKLQSQADLPPPMPLETKISNTLRYGTGHAQIVRVEVTDDESQSCASFEFEDYINIHAYFRAMVDITDFSVSFGIRDNTGITVMGTTLFDERIPILFVPAGTEGHVRFRFINHLRHGNYGVSVGLNKVKERNYSDNMVLDYALACATFQVVHNPERPIWYKFYGSIDVEYEVGQYSGKKDHFVDSKKAGSKTCGNPA